MARKQRRFTWIMHVTSIKRRTAEYAITHLELNFRTQIAHAKVMAVNVNLKRKNHTSELFSKLTFYLTFLDIIVEEEATFERLEDDIQTFKRGEEGGCSFYLVSHRRRLSLRISKLTNFSD